MYFVIQMIQGHYRKSEKIVKHNLITLKTWIIIKNFICLYVQKIDVCTYFL